MGRNNNPVDAKWSSIENAGSLRLYTASVTESNYSAKNTLTQRILSFSSDMNNSYGTIKLELGNMKDGDITGLSVFQDPCAYIGVKMIGNEKKIVYNSSSLTKKIESKEIIGATISETTIYLRAIANYITGKSNFYYSVDNKDFIKFGDEFTMKYDLSVFTGNKFAIFNYATKSLGGFVDIDWFSTEPYFDESLFYDDSFEGERNSVV